MTGTRALALIFFALLTFAIGTKSRASLTPAQANNPSAQSKAKFKHTARIRSTYDKSKNETLVILDQIDPLPVDPAYGFDFSDLRMSVYFTYQGTIPTKPETINLTFNWTSYDWKFNKKNTVTAKVDGKRLDLGTANMSDYLGLPGGRKGEVLVLSVPYLLFVQIITSTNKNVELHMGRAYFYFNKPTLEALRDLASRTTSL